MIRIVVNNFRALERADVTAAPIALVGGANEAGKTSLCQAARAALTGQVIPEVDGDDLALKSTAQTLVRAGASAGAVVTLISNDGEGTATVSWPQCERSTRGVAPQASALAAGTEKLSDMTAKERAARLIELIGAQPTRDDFAAALAEAGLGEINPASIDAVWQIAEAEGWEAAHARQLETIRNLKTKWAEITSERYGSRKADNWEPIGWVPELSIETEESLAHTIEVAKTGLENAIRNAAVSGAEYQRLSKSAGQREAAEAQRNAARAQFEAAEAAHAEAKAALLRTPNVGGVSGQKCPHCGKGVRARVDDFGLTYLEACEGAEDPAEFDRLYRAYQAAQKAEATASARISTARTNVMLAEATLNNAIADAERLAELGDCREAQAVEQAAREMVSKTEANAEIWRRRQRAGNVARAIERNLIVADVLGPTGFRAKLLRGKLTDFNDRLAGVAATAGWPAPYVDPETWAIKRGGLAYLHLSASARWRVDLLLQILCAAYDRSGMLVVDAFDQNDTKHRNGAFAALAASGLPALVCMTTPLASLPDIGRNGVGRSYWIEGGVVSEAYPVADAAQ